MKYSYKIVIIFLIGALQSCQNNDTIELVNEGKTIYQIRIDDDSLLEIGNTLKDYIFKISEAELVISKEATQSEHVIYIKVNKTLELNEVSYQAINNNIFIIGGSVSATKNAVYEFLEKEMGCKWYAPGEEFVPKQNNISISRDLNYSYVPKITTRTVHSALFYENADFAKKHKVTQEAFPNYVPDARVHTFHKFIPEEKFYNDHPEYFALRGTKRLPTQLCLTNNDVLTIVTDSVSAYFKRSPKATVLSVSQNDNSQYCECKNCSAIDKEEGSVSGTMIRFVNAIAAKFPKKTISTLAYQYTRKPSKVKPISNVLITLCSIECDRSAPIEEKCKDFATDLEGWGKLTSNIRIWDYTTQFTNFLTPFPNFRTLQPNIKFFKTHNANWVFEQHSRNPSELFELRSYVMAKLLWNPDANYDELVFEFTEGYYGKAGIYVREYLKLIHDRLAEDKEFFLFLYGDPSEAFDSYLNKDFLAEYDNLYNEAEAVVTDDLVKLARVKRARISIDYAILEASKKNLSKQFKMIVLEDDKKIANPYVLDKLESFYKICRSSNISWMNEMGFKVNEYYEGYKKALVVAAKPNKASGKKVILKTKPKKYANEDAQVLTDGALGGNNFYANWLGFEGNHLEAIIDLEHPIAITSIGTAFLQVTNHIVFFPEQVSFYVSNDNKNFKRIKVLVNDKPLTKTSKKNAIKYFEARFPKVEARYIKIKADNLLKAPYWHNAAGLPSWIFIDEVIID